MANCKAKRIDERRLHYAIEGIEFKITEEKKIFETTEVSDLNRDYTSEFLKKVQKYYGENIEIFVPKNRTHTTLVSIDTPFGTFYNEGVNKKEAARLLCKELLENFKYPTRF